MKSPFQLKCPFTWKKLLVIIPLSAILAGLVWQESAGRLSVLATVSGREASGSPRWAQGTNGMVAATTGGVAVQAGIAILKEGGTAADAAMATALSEVVHAGGSYVSFGGIMMMVYYEAATGRVYFMDAQYNTPLAETKPLYIPAQGGRTALVPGFMAGVQAAHDKFGKVPFKRLFEPAIALAEKGEPVTAAMAWWIGTKKGVLSRFPETKRIFTKKNGHFYRYGDLFRQPELAETLRNVAAQGATYMYDGEWGKKFVHTIQKNGGKITQQDMTNYHAIWQEPLRTTYRDYQVCAAGSGTWGGVNAVEGLNLLELASLKQYGHYTKSPRSLFWFMQIEACETLTWQWRDFHQHDLSPAARATKQTSAWLWQQMQEGKLPWLPKGTRDNPEPPGHTDGLVVVDQWGNMAVVNHTINTMLWGNTGIFVDGVSIPDSAAFQPREIANAGPGHRLPNGMSPLIILRAGKPVLGSSAVGAGVHPKTMQVLANILDFDMDPQTAVDTPAFLMNGGSGVAGQVERNTFDPNVLAGVRAMGMKVNVVSREKASPGFWVGIQIDPTTGRLKGGVSQGLEGQVEAY